MQRLFGLLFLILVLGFTSAQTYKRDAGLWPSLGLNRTVYVTSNPARAFAVADSIESSHWQADGCFPNAYWSRSDLNLAKGICMKAGACTFSKTTNGNASADGDANTASAFQAASGKPAFLRIKLPAVTTVRRIGYKVAIGSGTKVTISVVFGNNAVQVVASAINSDTYLPKNVKGPWANVAAVLVQANTTNTDFSLFELAVMSTACTESATLDLGAVKSLGVIRTRHWAGGFATSSALHVSSDNITWSLVKSLDPRALGTIDTYINPMIKARFIRVQHTTTEGDWNKVYVWTIDAYDQYGPWGPPPVASVNKKTFRQLLGVNGIWGFGAKDNSYASNYTAVASWARNYHNMNWDVKIPQNDPKYDRMASTGTDANWWLNWDTVYNIWRKNFQNITVTYQFTNDVQIPVSSQWGANVTKTAYNLGYKFAQHFGPTSGTGNVAAFEVGNEPWGYDFDFYQKVLKGFLDGLVDGDPALLRLPCALQAVDPNWDQWKFHDYIGYMVPADYVNKLSAINLHVYSYFRLDNNDVRGVHPEHPGSSMNGVNNMVRWRDANAPNKPVWVTEWGWDASRDHVGEKCNFTECVTQQEQAVYAVRGLLSLARKQVDLAIWFFYGNSDDCNTRYCRSGLRDIIKPADGQPLKELAVYRALKGFLDVAGEARFHGVVREDDSAYIYLLQDPSNGAVSHFVAWRPINRSNTAATSITFTSSLLTKPPIAAFNINGSGATSTKLPTRSGTTFTLSITSAPTVVVFSNVIAPPAPPPWKPKEPCNCTCAVTG